MEGLVAWGTVDDIANRVNEHLNAGADYVCLQVLEDSNPKDLMQSWRELARPF